MSIKALREATPVKSYASGPFSVVICRFLSPIISIPAIKWKISPNTITILMVLSGLLGGILFSIPNIYIKALSVPIYILWFIFDCSDGEVARFTGKFSKYGKQLDWMAHLTCHPLYIIGLWSTFFQYRTDCFLLITIICFVLLSLELINRTLVSINDLFVKENNKTEERSDKPKGLINYIKNQLYWFPNQVLLFPLLFLTDIISDTPFFIYIFISWSLLYSIYVLKRFVVLIIIMYKS